MFRCWSCMKETPTTCALCGAGGCAEHLVTYDDRTVCPTCRQRLERHKRLHGDRARFINPDDEDDDA